MSLIKDITSEQLTTFLESLAKERFKDFSIDYELRSKLGVNNFGEVKRVIIRDNESGNKDAPLSFFIKFNIFNEQFAQIMDLNEIYKQEIHFYSNIMTEFNNLSAKYNASKCFTNLPKCVAVSHETKKQFIVLEDMEVCGFIIRNKLEPMDYEHCKLVMQQLGRFHGFSFALSDKNSDSFRQLMSPIEERILLQKNAPILEPCVQRGYNCLNAETDHLVFQRYKKFADNFMTELAFALNYERTEKYAVLAHGDVWNNNLLFSYSNLGKPAELSIIDFQMMKLCSPIFDLMHFIYCSTDKVTRDVHFEQLMTDYYESLSTTLTSVGCDPTKVFSRETFNEQLRKYGRSGLISSLIALTIYMGEGQETDVQEICTNPDINEKWHEATGQNLAYNRKLRDIIHEMVHRNFI